MLEYFELPCHKEPLALMVWLHGLGADGYDLEPAAEMLGLANIRHVFPHAPVRPVTINGGLAMRAWYDIPSNDLRGHEDRDGMLASARQVQELIDELQNGSESPVVLAGFSQGAVISLVTATLGIHSLSGVVAMSGYLPAFLQPNLGALHNTSVLMMHGQQDEVVPHILGKTSQETLCNHGIRAAWHSYMMPHTICQEEIRDMAKWLLCLPGLNRGA